jgi:hypothetical protein
MENLNMNKILEREKIECAIKDFLIDFEKNKHNVVSKRGIYIYGDPGTGKTSFILSILKSLHYDVIKYDAGDIRNKLIIDNITKYNMSDKNIMSMFHKKVKNTAVIMDEIDGMNNGDKGGINALIKLIRPKKTKKQKVENICMSPIICIGNYHVDKKIKELIKVCFSVELKRPTQQQMKTIIMSLIPQPIFEPLLLDYVECDLRKLQTMYNLYKNDNQVFENNDIKNILNIFEKKSHNDDSKIITAHLLSQQYSIDKHNTIMNETDRTIVGLLWHENIIDTLGLNAISFYLKVLDNICFSDYIDRITFQKQIWQLNEMTSLIKTMKNNKLYHESPFAPTKITNKNTPPVEIRFTKVLTKYSTEYNNSLFIQNLCQLLGMDKKDLFGFFLELKNNNQITDDDANVANNNEITVALFENYGIGKLDIQRIYKYIEKYTKENAAGIADDEIIDNLEIIEETYGDE